MPVTWTKLRRPKPWKPTEIDDEIAGHFLGTSVREGLYGEYTVALIAVQDASKQFSYPMSVSGVGVISALHGACVVQGALIRIVYRGLKDLEGGRKMKCFDAFVGDGELSTEELEAYAYLVKDEED